MPFALQMVKMLEEEKMADMEKGCRDHLINAEEREDKLKYQLQCLEMNNAELWEKIQDKNRLAEITFTFST